MAARTLILNGLAQSNLDMAGYSILNLGNPSNQPPTVVCPPSNWLNGWNSNTLTWTYAQPNFTDLAGNLTSSQQTAIVRLGTIVSGVWNGSPLLPLYVPMLDAIRSPANSVSLNNQKITNLADPVNPLDACNYRTVQGLATGLQPKQACAVASTSEIAVMVGLLTIDGYTLQVGDRILVKDQSGPPGPSNAFNGIYVASTSSWTRATDMNTNTQFPGALTNILNGTTNGGTSWVCTTQLPITLGTTPITFVLFSQAAQTISPGPGLALNGNVMSAVGTAGRIAVTNSIDIDANYVGQGSITTLGTITTGQWASSIISPQYGGTGVNNGGYTVTLAGNYTVKFTGGALGANPLQFDISGPTEIVLPNSGTMATLSGVETFTNKSIGASQINSGILAISVGGTGANSSTQAALNLLPPISPSTSGKSLKNDGVHIFWG